MNVAYFSNHFAAADGHGVARYANHLYSALRKTQPEIDLLPCATWSPLEGGQRKKLIDETGLETMPWGRKVTPLAWTFTNWPPVEKWLSRDIDLVHLIALNFPVATRKPLVVTVHDIGPLTHPEYFSIAPPWLLRKSVKYLVRHADGIVCVSQATADELERYVKKHHGQSISDRIHVVHEGVERKLFEPVDLACLDQLADLPDAPYLLTAGKISPRKNLQGVIRSMIDLGDKIPHHLLAVGGSGWDTGEVDELLKHPAVRDRIHLLGYVTDDQLRALYQNATCYMHPSLFEGFGLTVLEAMAAGCPVITSNVFSLPEVAGDAAILVDPTSTTQIAEAIESVCTSETVADDLSKRGRARAEGFTWDKCAMEVGKVYRHVL